MKQWLKLQRDLYSRAFKEAARLHGPRSLRLKTYERAYQRDFQSLQPSTEAAFQQALKHAGIFILGDFHPLRQSQRTLLRFLRDSKIQKPMTLGLEILPFASERQFENLLNKGQWSAIQNLLRVEARFGSSFETYREIFEICRKLKIKILGLGSKAASLSRQDIEAAQRICKTNGRTWILFGEFHCARSHLPAQILKRRPQSKILILQQNEDATALKRLEILSKKKTLYLKSQNSGVSLYCVLHTPLWVKWQSFIDRHLRVWSDDEVALPAEVDAREQVNWSLNALYEFLNDSRYPLTSPLRDILDFELHTSDESTFYRALGRLKAKTKTSVIKQLKISNAAVASHERILFLSEVTLNSCAHLAASFFYRRTSLLHNDDLDFYRSTLSETLSFFLSKILNHSRRAQTWADWKRLQADPSSRPEATAVLKAESFSQHFANRRRWRQGLGRYQLRAQEALARILGDALFEAFLAGEFAKERFQRLLISPIESEAQAFEVLVELKSVGAPFERRLEG